MIDFDRSITQVTPRMQTTVRGIRARSNLMVEEIGKVNSLSPHHIHVLKSHIQAVQSQLEELAENLTYMEACLS